VGGTSVVVAVGGILVFVEVCTLLEGVIEVEEPQAERNIEKIKRTARTFFIVSSPLITKILTSILPA